MDFQTLNALIRDADDPMIPITELLDEDENLELIQKKKGIPTRFAQLRNKFAHGDILQLMGHPSDFYSYLPRLDELKLKYSVDFYGDFPVRMDLPGYVQLTKCMKFLLKWRENLFEHAEKNMNDVC